MVKTRAIKEITFPRRYWKAAKIPKQPLIVVGWDTETYPEGHKFQGRTFVLTRSDGQESRQYIIKSPEDLINAFYEPGTRKIHFFYNLTFDIEGMLKWFGKGKFFQILSETTEFVELIPGIFAKLIKDKCFIIGEKTSEGRMHQPMRVFDIAQFYDKKPLRKVAPIVGMKKGDEDPIVNIKRFQKDIQYRSKYLEYAVTDAVICQALANRFYQAIQTIIPCKDFFSTASIGKQFILSKGIDESKKIPKLAFQYALLSCSGARIECAKRGTFDKANLIDIVSAYPYQETKLASVANMNWYKVTDGCIDPEAIYGYYCITTETYDEKFALLPYKNGATLSYPIGKREFEFVTKQEVLLLQKRGFKVKIHGGIEGFDDDPIYPFECIRDIFKERFDLKEEMKKLKKQGKTESAIYTEYDLKQLVYKIIMNSIYGCFLQLTPNTKCINWTEDIDLDDIVIGTIFDENMTELCKIWDKIKWKAGIMFDPVYGSNILASTRCNLYELVYEHNLEDKVIFFATDSIALDNKLPNIKFSNELGDWDLQVEQTKLTVVGSGLYSYEQDGEVKTYTRGFKKQNHNPATCKECLEGTGCNQFDFRNVTQVRQKFTTKPKPVRAASAIRQDRFEDINIFMKQEKTFDLNFDTKRNWLGQFKKAKDLWTKQIDSLPLNTIDLIEA